MTDIEDKTNTNGVANPEVKARRPKRRFTTAYKLNIVKQADQCVGPGEIGALLRREAIYSSSLTKWRRDRDNGTLTSTKSESFAKKQSAVSKAEHAQLKKRNQDLERQLKQAQAVIEIQKKVSEIYGLTTLAVKKSEERL